LRDYLRANGVFVRKQPRLSIVNELYNVLTEEEQHEWTKEEIEDQINSFHGFNTSILKSRLPAIPTPPAATTTIPAPPAAVAMTIPAPPAAITTTIQAPAAATMAIPVPPSTVMKPYVDGVGDDEKVQGIDEIQHEGQEESAQEPERTGQDSDETQQRYRQNVTTITTFLSNKEMLDLGLSKRLRAEGKITTKGPPFFVSRRKEIDGQKAKGVFEIATNEDHAGRLFKSRFVDEIKGKATDYPLEKSRLVIQAYNDDGKREILTQSPTIQRVSQRIILCIAAYKRIHESKPSSQAFYTDYKYHTGPRPQNRFDRQSNRYQGKSDNNFKKFLRPAGIG
jgi:hypothetical protein